jgi:hypothetical protein
MGGIRALPHAATFGHRLTAPLAIKAGWPAPATLFDDTAALNMAGESVEVLFPGAGHAPDNIVVWLPKHDILFGGCLVKPQAAQDLGNLADANVPSWDHALTTVIQHFPNPALVVPGHGDIGGRQLLSHTQELVRAKLGDKDRVWDKTKLQAATTATAGPSAVDAGGAAMVMIRHQETKTASRTPPKLPYSPRLSCETDRDCAIVYSRPCLCPNCGTSWREVLNRHALGKLKASWAKKRCRLPECPKCESHLLGTKAICRAGQCTVE